MILFYKEFVDDFGRFDARDSTEQRIVILMLGDIATDCLDPLNFEVLSL